MRPDRAVFLPPTNLGYREPDRHALLGDDNHVIVVLGEPRRHQLVAFLHVHDNQPRRPDVRDGVEGHPLDDPSAGRQNEIGFVVIEPCDAYDGLDLLSGAERHDGLDRDAPGVPGEVRPELVGRYLDDAALVREEQQSVVRVDDQYVVDWVVVFGVHAGDALPAPVLAAEGTCGNSLDVPAPAERYDDLLVSLQLLPGELMRLGGDLRPPRLSQRLLELRHLLHDLGHYLRRVGEKGLKAGDGVTEGLVLVLDPLALKGGESPELHLQDGVRLELVEHEARHELAPRALHVR